MTAPQRQFVLAYGSPFDGMGLDGPFDSMDEAVEYANDRFSRARETKWEIVELNKALKSDVEIVKG